MEIVDKIRNGLLKIEEIIFGSYEACYTTMEREGHAVMGNCSGSVGSTSATEYLSESCIGCPHLCWNSSSKKIDEVISVFENKEGLELHVRPIEKDRSYYPIITLLGSSTKFKEYFKKYEKDLTFHGYIVLSLGFFNEPEDFIPTEGQKKLLISMMHQKIEMSDTVFVINPGGYIGEHTKEEIEYAAMLGKTIIYLEDD